jgi:hypothetical protein
MCILLGTKSDVPLTLSGSFALGVVKICSSYAPTLWTCSFFSFLYGFSSRFYCMANDSVDYRTGQNMYWIFFALLESRLTEISTYGTWAVRKAGVGRVWESVFLANHLRTSLSPLDTMPPADSPFSFPRSLRSKSISG